MKIRLSEDEVYEIKMPEEIGMNDFAAIVAKFNFFGKTFQNLILETQVMKKMRKD